jgi:hypothetical protein
MNIVTESGFWKSVQDQHLCPETLKYLFKSLADLDKIKINNDKESGEINFIDNWYFQWDIVNNEVHISNLYRCNCDQCS